MDVISYLDASECVCFVMRPLAIWANDYMNDAERSQLLPYILRAMGSRTDDRAEIMRRLDLVVAFARKMAKLAAEYAESATENAAVRAEAVVECATSAATPNSPGTTPTASQTASGVKQADALPAVHQGQETEASDHSGTLDKPTPSIPEPVADAIRWLNEAGRSMVADQLGLWAERAEDALTKVDAALNEVNAPTEAGGRAVLLDRNIERPQGRRSGGMASRSAGPRLSQRRCHTGLTDKGINHED